MTRDRDMRLSSPELRKELLEILRELLDIEHPRQFKVNNEFLLEFKDDYSDCIVQFIYFRLGCNFLYARTSLMENPERAISIFLHNQKEVQTIKAVVQALERVFTVVGIDALTEEYLSCSEWLDVIVTVTDALWVMKRNDAVIELEHNYYSF